MPISTPPAQISNRGASLSPSTATRMGSEKTVQPWLYTRQAASSADHAGVRVRYGNRFQNLELQRIFDTVVHDLNPAFGINRRVSGRHNSYVPEAAMSMPRGLQRPRVRSRRYRALSRIHRVSNGPCSDVKKRKDGSKSPHPAFLSNSRTLTRSRGIALTISEVTLANIRSNARGRG